jgi:hypothetical protein
MVAGAAQPFLLPIQALELHRIIFELNRSGIGVLMTDHNMREPEVKGGYSATISISGWSERSKSPEPATAPLFFAASYTPDSTARGWYAPLK